MNERSLWYVRVGWDCFFAPHTAKAASTASLIMHGTIPLPLHPPPPAHTRPHVFPAVLRRRFKSGTFLISQPYGASRGTRRRAGRRNSPSDSKRLKASNLPYVNNRYLNKKAWSRRGPRKTSVEWVCRYRRWQQLPVKWPQEDAPGPSSSNRRGCCLFVFTYGSEFVWLVNRECVCVYVLASLSAFVFTYVKLDLFDFYARVHVISCLCAFNYENVFSCMHNNCWRDRQASSSSKVPQSRKTRNHFSNKGHYQSELQSRKLHWVLTSINDLWRLAVAKKW